MLRDLRLAVRMLVVERSWTAIVLLLLALGIGANTALFSAVNGLLLRKLPVRDPDTLVRFRSVGPNEMRTDVLTYGFTAPDARGRPVEASFSYPMYREWLAANQTLSDLMTCAPLGRVNVVYNGQAETATGFLSSGNYYRALGAQMRLGRAIEPDDDRAGAPPVAIVSHKYWMSRFGGSPGIVGAVATVNNTPVTIVGVLAPEFTGIDQPIAEPPDVWLPISLEPQVNLQPSNLQTSLLGAPNFWWLQVVGRLRPGVTAAQAEGNFAGVFQQAARAQYDGFLSSLTPQQRSLSFLQNHTQVPELRIDSASHGIYDATATDLRAVSVLTAVVALVLLIVCANVANLLLSRSTSRQKEISIRLALGATRGRLVRQLLTESLLLAGVGGALGLLIGRWSQRLLPGAIGQTPPLDWRVLAFLAAVTTATGVVFGLAPALRATRTDVNAGLKTGSGHAGRSRSVLGNSLVVAQVTISLMLLVGAGLFLQTLQNLRHVDVGYNPRNLLLFRISPALNRYDAQKQDALYRQLAERLQSIGGVRATAWSNNSLMSGRRFITGLFVQGRAYARGRVDRISYLSVSPTFLETMEIPVIAGRGFDARDSAPGAPPVAMINEAAARQYFPGESPIGRRVGSSIEDSGKREIVGVLRDAKYNAVRDLAVPTMFVAYTPPPAGGMTFEMRTAGDPLGAAGAVRDAVRRIDPNLPIINMATGLDEIEDRFSQERLFAEAYALFGGLALLVASVGLFGLMSYSVARRTSEIGIRMALGARRPDVLGLVMRESLVLVAAGVAIGIFGAAAASRLIAGLLYGLAPTDPSTMAGAVAVMAVVSAVAGYFPARRATRVDPLVALRHE